MPGKQSGAEFYDFRIRNDAGDCEAVFKVIVPETYHTNEQEFIVTLQEEYEDECDGGTWDLWSKVDKNWLVVKKKRTEFGDISYDEHLEIDVYAGERDLAHFEEDYGSDCVNQYECELVADYISWQCKEHLEVTLEEMLDGPPKSYLGQSRR